MTCSSNDNSISVPSTKICTSKSGCNKEKLLTEFFFRKDRNIYTNQCLICHNKKQKELNRNFYLKNRDQEIERSKKYRSEHFNEKK